MQDLARISRLVCIGVSAWLALPPNAYADDAAFRHGIAVAHSMAWAQVAPGSAKAFVDPPFGDQDRRLRTGEMQSLRRAGFDFIRFAVDPGPFLQFTGTRRDLLDQFLLEQVELILSCGLSVMVDFHPGDLHPQYTGRALTDGAETPAFQSYLRLLERTAVLLDTLGSRRVALELMNEPPVSAARWQPMLEAAYRAARHRAPHLMLVLPGANEGMPEGLIGMRIAAFRNDTALRYTFHYYDPFQFTHQGASWNAARYLADVPYPARARPLQDSLDATAAAIQAADLSPVEKARVASESRRQLENYRRSGFDRASIAASLERIVGWGRSNGVASSQILLGEFGALRTGLQTQGVRAAERRQWFSDVRAEAEARNFPWAVWVYRGTGGFALTPDDRGANVDPAITEAIGLKPDRQLGAPTE